jgi:wyosine [tRNA(Phe)-imidazoG37] synthetase (radical SAM superfamily)
MDCIYCESGKTTELTTERREYQPTSAIIAELDECLSTSPKLDYVTFSGAGEPTLHSGIGEIITFIKKRYPAYKTCLLTNAMSLALDKSIFSELKTLDLIVPSLDSVDSVEFATINRPAVTVDPAIVIETLAQFKKESTALMHLEIFIAKGVNDSKNGIARFAKAVRLIAPDKVQINSLDRPGTEKWVEPADVAFLNELHNELAKLAETEIVAKFAQKSAVMSDSLPSDARVRILEIVSRRPCTAEDISLSMNCKLNLIVTLLSEMRSNGELRFEERERGGFYLSLLLQK